MFRSGVSIAAVLMLSACAVPSLAYGDLDAALQGARCERFVTCGVFPSVDECMRIFPVVADQDAAAAIADGKITYRGDYAEQCVAGLTTLSCDTTSHAARDLPDACRFMFEGNLAEGDACSFDRECFSRRCEIPTTESCGTDSCCAGTCGSTALAVDTEACLRGTDCADGFYCGSDRVCHTIGEDGDTCVNDAQCDLGLACSLGACRAPVADGEACPFGRCSDLGDYCDATTKVCTAFKAVGEACASATECSPYDVCDTTCKALAKLGDPCGMSGLDCDSISRCDATTETCMAPLENGMPCDEGHECTSGYCKPGAVFDTCADNLVCD
jgi:hypothetical protein